MAGEIVLEALRAILRALRKLGENPVLVGGLGIQAWGRMRQTKDVDLLVLSDEPGRERLFAAAEAEGLVRDPVRPVVTVSRTTILRLAYTDPRFGMTVRVDLIEAGKGFLSDVARRARATRLFGEELRLASCEDLILMKLLAGRPIDRADAADLLRINAAGIDQALLDNTAGEQGLSSELRVAREEASRRE
jgi:hypothetical protein